MGFESPQPSAEGAETHQKQSVEKSSQPVVVEAGDRNVDLRIENLSADEKELFDAASYFIETEQNYIAFRKEGKINEAVFHLLHAQLRGSVAAEKMIRLQEQFGDKKFNQIAKFAAKSLNDRKKQEIFLTPKNIELTPENIKNAVEGGIPIKVKVLRSSGEVEEGWLVMNYKDDSGLVTVFKFGDREKNEPMLRKSIPLDELKKINS